MKYEVIEAFVDKENVKRYEKGSVFEGNKKRTDFLKKEGYLGEEIKEDLNTASEGSGSEDAPGDDGTTGDGE